MRFARKKHKHFTPEQRLEVLRLSEELRSVSDACKQSGMDRASFYKWKSRFEAEGKSALSNRRGTGRFHPRKIPDLVAGEIIETALTYPNWGCGKVAKFLSVKGVKVSSPTVQAVFVRKKISSIKSRVYALESEHFLQGRKLTSEQVRLIEKNNPAFREREAIGSYPGEFLVQDTFFLGDEFERVYMHVILDTYSAYLFTHIDNDKSAEIAADMLGYVARFFRSKELVVKKVLTDSGYEFTRYGGTYSKIAITLGIEHRITKTRKHNWNGFIDQFNTYLRTRIKRAMSGDSIFMKRLDGRAKFFRDIVPSHNHSNFSGFPNYGVSPINRLQKYKLDKQVK